MSFLKLQPSASMAVITDRIHDPTDSNQSELGFIHHPQMPGSALGLTAVEQEGGDGGAAGPELWLVLQQAAEQRVHRLGHPLALRAVAWR